MSNRLDPLLRKPLQATAARDGLGFAQALLKRIEFDPAPLLDLANRPVVSARQFDRAKVLQLCRLAAFFEVTPQLVQRPLEGKIMINAFYEPSTRTRLSFESAWHRLGGDAMAILYAASTGIAKGESLTDVAEMFNNYGDVVVLRDSSEQAVYEMLPGLRIPIINGGNGVDEHPTQALADLFAILKWRAGLTDEPIEPAQRARVGIIGVPARMRTVRSLLLLLTLFAQAFEEVVIVCDSEDAFDEGQREELDAAGLKLRVTTDLNTELPRLDVVYINSIAWVGDNFERMGEALCLTMGSPLKPNAIILHPLARGDELSTELDATPHNWYFTQARGAVFLRMALLTSVAGRVHQVIDAPTREA